MGPHTGDNKDDIPKLLRMPFAAGTTLVYVAIAGLWIYYSDRLLVFIAQTPEQQLFLSTAKGWFFVVITAMLLFFTLSLFTTKIRRTNQQLRSSMEQRSITLNAIGDAVIATDAQGRVELLNPVAETLTGWPVKEALHRPLQEVFKIIDERSRQEVENPVARVLHDGIMVGLTNHTLLIARDGVEHPIADSAAPICDEQGAITGVVLVFRDQSDERRTYNALIETKERLQTVMDSVDALVYIADIKTHELLFINAYGSRIWGDSIVGQPCWKVFQGLDGPCSFCSNDRILTADGMATGVYQWEFQNGINGRWYDVHDRAIEWTDGRMVRLEVATDITERKQGEVTLRENERELQRAQVMAHIGSWRIDLGTGFVTGSEEAGRIYGLEDMGWSLQQIQAIPLAHHRQKLDEGLRGLVENGAPYDFEFEIRRPSDDTIGHIHSVAEFDAERNTVFGTIHDISDYRKAEAALRESEEFLNNVMTGIQDGICVLHPDLTVRYTNPVMETWYGDRLPLLGQKCHQCYHGSDTPCSSCPALRCLESKQMETEIIAGPDGSKVKWLEMCCYPMLNPETGDVTGIIEFIHDISERLSLEGQLRQAQKMESVGRLAGGIAHDFNNMLSVIIGYTELAMDTVSPDDQLHGQLGEIHKAAQRSAKITRQLLAFARKQTIAPRVLDLNETVEGMLIMLRRLIGEDINLTWLPGRDLWPIKMDPAQIDQILANLCVNARDAIVGIGRITIETDRVELDEAYCTDHVGFVPGEYVQLTVSDDGCGMDRDTQDKLFEPFFTTKDLDKGTGLGLATVYGIIKQNKGFIHVYSEPEKGTSFTLYLPRYAGEAGEEKYVEVKPIPQAQGEVILIVEDETAILKLGLTMLERLGYTVLTAATPGAALQLAEAYKGTIDLLITDVVMPEMNGRDLSELMKKRHPDLRILFMSGYTADVIAHHGVLDDNVIFMQKPFSTQEIATKVRLALAGG